MMFEEERQSDHDSSNGLTSPYYSMDKSKLQELAILAIREHRRLLAADQEVYDEWSRADLDPMAPQSVKQALRDEHLARRKKSEAQQMGLSEIIDALGYVPDLPSEDTNGLE